MADPVNRSGSNFSLPRDSNRVPAVGGVLASDGKTVNALELDGSGNLLVNVAAGGTSGTQYAELATTAPGTGTLSLGRYKSVAPSLTDGQLYGLQLDSSGNLKVTGSLSVGGTTDNSAFTAGSSTGTPSMGFYHSTVDTVTDGRAAALAIDSKRNLFTVLRDAAGNARGVNVTAGNALTVDASATTQPVSGTVTANLGTIAGVATSAKQDTGNTSLSSIDGKVPALGQALAAASVPVILPSATVTTLTPPAAITNFANETGGNLAAIKTDVDKIPSQGQALAAASMPVVLPATQITTLTPPTSQGTPTADSAPGAGTLGSLNSTFDILIAGYNSLSFVVSGTWVGTITFYASSDSSTFVPIHAFSVDNMGTQPTTTANGTFIPFYNAGMRQIRCKMTSYSSGTATITPRLSSTQNYQRVYEAMTGMPIPQMGAAVMGSDGSNAQFLRTNTTGNPLVLSASATGSSVPANAFYTGGTAQTSLPSAASAGNLTGLMTDKFGRQVVLIDGIRDITGTQTTTISASTAETTVGTAVASTFLDLTSVLISNTSATATRVDFRDTTAGSVLFSLYVPAGDMRGFVVHTPIPQTTVNTNLTAQSSASVTDLRVFVKYIRNK